MKQLPDKSEIPTLLENVSSLGTAAGLQFKLFKPMPEVPKNFYAEIPVDIQVEGKYRDIVTFFDNVSKMPRIVNIVNIIYQAPQKGSRSGGTMVSTSCKAVTYKFIEGRPRPKRSHDDKKQLKGGEEMNRIYLFSPYHVFTWIALCLQRLQAAVHCARQVSRPRADSPEKG
ncbi:MAG: type 4a pilus biogenesis protein PilO [Desulfobacterales bacterium]|nr:type 4a pilus biogenesis protein PilO [Desulfobacterales bacterium]